MVTDLVILGSGGLAQEYAWLVEEINLDKKSFNLLGYLDDAKERAGGEYLGYPVLGTIDALSTFRHAVAIAGVGDPRSRKTLVERFRPREVRWASLVSPTARVHPSNRIGHGVMIGRYSTVTVGCEIGNHVMLNVHCVVGHAVRIGDFSVISPNVTVNGEAEIGSVCYIGANAFVRNVRVGDGATVGGSSAVVKDVPPGCVVAGVPAKILHEGAPSHRLTRVPTLQGSDT